MVNAQQPKIMNTVVKRPLLIGGVGLSVGLWLLESLQQPLLEMGGAVTVAAIAAGTGVWLWQRRGSTSTPPQQVPIRLERPTVERAIASARDALQALEAESESSPAAATLSRFHQRLVAATTDLDRSAIRIALVGGKASGKSTLVKVLASPEQFQSPQRLTLQEIPAFTALGDANPLLSGAMAADLVLFLTTGDLTEPDYRTLQHLMAGHQRLLIVLTKLDQYLPNDRPLLLNRLCQHLHHLRSQQPSQPQSPNPSTAADDVIAIAANPSPLKVRRHQPDGSIDEWQEIPTPEIAALTQRLHQLLAPEESQQLVWTTGLRSALALHQDIQSALNQVRRDRALPLLEQYQWIAAAAAFANPVPALDLLATGAITAQLVLDLGAIYRQPLSLQQGQVVATTMASLLVKLGLVELSTQLLGSLLKSNAATFVAGGLLQGASAAYLTRLAGLSLMDYFQDQQLAVNLQAENPLAIEPLTQRLQTIFQQNRQLVVVQALLQRTISRLLPEQPPGSPNSRPTEQFS